jgi:hypothetical protein
VPVEPSRFAYSVVTPRGYKAGGRSYLTYIFPHDLPPSSRFYGRVRLACVKGHAGAPTKLSKSGVYDSGRVSYLSRAQRSYISCSGEEYVVACVAFYEQGFGVPSYLFLHSLLHSMAWSCII